MKDQSPLERAARALCKFEHGVEVCWTQYVPEARAVLMAIREPSYEMIYAGFHARDMERSPISIWESMIDAALANTPSSAIVGRTNS